jgi:Cu(I)/Ag(I) efflux system membrane fusion protein
VNNKIMITIGVVIAFAVGAVVGPRLADMLSGETTGSEETSKEKEVLYWVAPMDPKFKSDKPGKSPMGMDLVPVCSRW